MRNSVQLSFVRPNRFRFPSFRGRCIRLNPACCGLKDFRILPRAAAYFPEAAQKHRLQANRLFERRGSAILQILRLSVRAAVGFYPSPRPQAFPNRQSVGRAPRYIRLPRGRCIPRFVFQNRAKAAEFSFRFRRAAFAGRKAI